MEITEGHLYNGLITQQPVNDIFEEALLSKDVDDEMDLIDQFLNDLTKEIEGFTNDGKIPDEYTPDHPKT